MRRRGLRANRPNNFAIFTEETFTKVFHQLTDATFLVMILISSISLIVGGIGVMNIMLVAVTERTREIGLRKALGAQRVTILQQFLFEAMLLTTIGGAIGLAGGAGVAQLVRAVSGLPAHTPLWVMMRRGVLLGGGALLRHLSRDARLAPGCGRCAALGVAAGAGATLRRQ
jgi:putative ABC transport system permease protein